MTDTLIHDNNSKANCLTRKDLRSNLIPRSTQSLKGKAMEDRIIIKHKGFITSDRPGLQTIKDTEKAVNQFEMNALKEIKEEFFNEDFKGFKSNGYKADFQYTEDLEKATITLYTDPDTIMETDEICENFILVLSENYLNKIKRQLSYAALRCELGLSYIFAFFVEYGYSFEIQIDSEKIHDYISRDLKLNTKSQIYEESQSLINHPDLNQKIKKWIAEINIDFYSIQSVDPEREFHKTERVLKWLNKMTSGFKDDIPCEYLLCMTLNNPFEKIPFGIFCYDMIRELLNISDTMTFGKLINTYYIPINVLADRIQMQWLLANERKATVSMTDANKTCITVPIVYSEDLQQEFLVFDNSDGNLPNGYRDCIEYAEFITIDKDALLIILSDYDTENLSISQHKLLKPSNNIDNLVIELQAFGDDQICDIMETFVDMIECDCEFPTTRERAYIIDESRAYIIDFDEI